jgi:hypothetical protein
MFARVLILLRARLAAYTGAARAPVAALLLQGLIAALLCGLARGELSPFAYGLVSTGLCGLLVAIPLSGELARLLVVDEAAEWILTQPVRAREVHLARLAHLLLALGTLALGSLLPAAALAPAGTGALGRAWIVLAGLELALVLAAVVLLVQSLLRGRAQGLLVFVQTVLFVGVVLAAALGARLVPALRHVASPADVPAAAFLPPVWFAAPLAEGVSAAFVAAGPLAALAALLLLVCLPAPEAPHVRRGEPLVSRLLAPARALALRTWVRREERAVFELVFDALPREPGFVLRAYPLVAVPLVFLALGLRQADSAALEGLCSLLCFTTAAYLPLVSSHVPASDSSEARWILATAPISTRAMDEGALKALAVRVVLPLYALLALLCASLGGAWLALRVALPAALTALVVLRATWSTCVRDRPLSVDPDELTINLDWLGLLGGLGLGLTIASVAVVRGITTPGALAGLCLVLLALVAFPFGREPRQHSQ